MDISIKKGISSQKKPAKKRLRLKYLRVILFVLPAFLPLFAFYILPIIVSLLISFTDWDYMSPEFNIVNLGNYVSLLTDARFYEVLWRTTYFTIGTVIPTVGGGLLLALLIHRVKGAGLYRTFLFSPWITPLVAVSIIWSWIFEPRVGLANWLLSLFNLPGLGWTSSTTWAMPAIIIVTVWSSVGWAMVFYLDALSKVPKHLYEAADIEGASGLQKFMNITLPLISPTTFFLIIISFIDSLQAFDQIQILTNGGPAGSTQTILYYYYDLAFKQFNMGRATSVAILLVIITAILSVIQFRLSKRWVHYQ